MGDAASFTVLLEVPVVPTAAPAPFRGVVPRFVEPAVPVPAGPQGSVVLPMLVDAPVPVPCVDVVVVPDVPVVVLPAVLG